MPVPPDPPGGLRTARRASLGPTERRVLDAIDGEGLLAFARELIEIPSLGGREDAAQSRVAEELARAGLSVDRWSFDVDSLRSHPRFSMEVERRSGLGVVGTLGSAEGGRDLILNGHVDVVPTGDPADWTADPWKATVRDGRLRGRGAADMKGGLACAVYAAKAIRDAGVRLRGRLLLESVIGEEDGGVGTLAACARGYRADGAIVLEPTRLQIAPAQAGALCFRLTVPGRSAHASVRGEGVSAIEKFATIHRALVGLERSRNRAARTGLFRRYRRPIALSLGTIRGGDWPSSVPDRVVVEGRYGIAVDEEVPAARRALEYAVAAAASRDPWLRDHPPSVEWWGGQFEPASVPTDDPVVTMTAGAVRDVTGRAARLEGVPYGSDMRLLVREAATPTILFGPGDVAQAHRANESVSIEELRVAARAAALAALRFCGTPE